VLERHILVITRADVDQDVPLDAADFEALVACMDDEPVLGFYNGGSAAGASQRHKHLQVVRLPLSPRAGIPVEALLVDDALPRFTVRHAFARVELDPGNLLERYTELRRALAITTQPYNLLVARGWMLLVPRRSADFEGIAVNSLAFAGALFVRDEAQQAALERLGPMAVLRGVSFPVVEERAGTLNKDPS
jgi:ATP adenylyltransferase